MKKPAASLLSRVFGKVNWSPPPWPGWLAGKARQHRRGVAIAFLSLAVAGCGGWKFWQWRQAELEKERAYQEAHRARPDSTGPVIRDLILTMRAPENPVKTAPKTFQPAPAVLDFEVSSAPLRQAPKEGAEPVKQEPIIVKGITISPAVEGEWRWERESWLVFRPAKPWPAGVEYKLHLPDDLELNPAVRVKERNYSFKTAPVRASVSSVVFYTDPANPAIHQAVSELMFSHPVTAADVEKHASLTVVGGTPLFDKDGKTPSPLCTLVADES
ncbi:MAG TPA: hypothetical protein VHM91_05980, partial [Verrucomicrobiales bacterium]|nr:hypothetical protein [Verrucomicrobiales bacterium]